MTRKSLALFGNPVSHSLSPAMHTAWIADHRLDAAYEARALDLDLQPDQLHAVMRAGVSGANVTVPFKEVAAQAAQAFSDTVEMLGVANTLSWVDVGEGYRVLRADNTDVPGARRALDEACDWERDVESVLIVGAGGAARGMAAAVSGDGRTITVANRTADKAALWKDMGLAHAFVGLDRLPDAVADADLIINTTTLGMKGQPDLDWPLERAKPGAIVYDAVYAPLETTLLSKARARGLRTVDGLGMLIHQGALAFEIWFGVKPDTKMARERLLKIIAEREG